MEAIVFDMDGVLLSTDRMHFEAWKALADRLGLPFDETKAQRCLGLSRMESLEIVLEGSGRSFTAEEKEALAEEKNRHYRALLRGLTPGDLPEETVEVLCELRRRGYRLALASSSKNAPEILSRTGLGELLDCAVDGNDVKRAKPDPEVFLLAAQRLGVAPERCVGVDDALSGVAAARAAGMTVAAVGFASGAGAGDWNLKSLGELLERCPGAEREDKA